MVVLELREIVDILVYNDVQVVGLIMRLDVADGESFRHGAGWGITLWSQGL